MAALVPKPDSPYGEPEKYSTDQLEAAGVERAITYDRPAHYVDIDPVAEAKLRRKLDIRLLPLCTLLYLLNYIDRAAIGNARVAGFDVDIGLKGYEFQYGLMVFYVVYTLVQVPSNLIFKKLGSMWLAALVVAFGIVSIASAFMQDIGGFMATRVFLGAAEGGLLPGIGYLLSRYYRRQELIFRIGFFLSLSPSLSGAFGGLLATGFLKTGVVGSIVRWRKIFLWEGVITTVVGILAFWILPTWPEKSRMLNDAERKLALARVQNEMTATKEEDDKDGWREGLKAFTIHSSLCMLGYSCINVSVQGLSTFMPTIIRNLGKFTPIEIQLRTVPPYVVAAVWSIALTFTSWKIEKRGVCIMISVPMAMLGYVLFLASKSPHARYAGCFLCFTGVVPLGPFFMAWAINNIPGGTAKAVVSALVPSLGTLGSVISVWAYTNNQAPDFKAGNALNLATTTCVFIIALFLTIWVHRQNAAKERGDYDHLLEGKNADQIRRLGHKHPQFRYID